MRILQVNKYHFIKGGADRVFFNTINLLEDNGHEVITFSTLRPENTPSKYSDYFVHYIERRRSNTLINILNARRYIYNDLAFKNIERIIREFKPEIAHLHLFYGDLSASILKALRDARIPVVQSVHDYRLLCPANALLDAKGNICEKCKYKSFYHCSVKRCLEGNFFFSSVLAVEGYFRKYVIDPLEYIDRFIFVSKFAEQKHIEFDRRFASKAVHLYNFTDMEDLELRTNKGKYFLFFGRVSKEKGIETLLAAADGMKTDFRIAGSGPLEEEVKRFATNHKNVTFLGHQSGKDLRDLIKNASFVVVPSEWYENNPMTIIEAYASGVPVIASRIGGIPEIVSHGKTGFLFESRDASDLARALDLGDKISYVDYSIMSRNCREFAAREFSPGGHYDRLIDIYSKLLKDA